MKPITAATLITLVGLASIAAIEITDSTEASPVVSEAPTLPTQPTTTSRPTESHGDTTESTTTAPATTTTTLPDTECAEWWPVADSIGWTPEQWETLSYIIWRESRCLPWVHNADDPNGGSYGLTQINGFWIDYLCEQWEICHPNELYDPTINLGSAWVIYTYSVEKNGCGYHPWRISC